MDTSLFFILLTILAVLVIVLGYFVVKIYKLFGTLQKGVEEDLSKKGFDEVRKRLSFLEEDGKLHSQKISLLRFNPFDELGGDHSFALAILDGHDSGIIISSLHTRDRTRVYVKEIKKGICDVQLSSEEKKVLDKAVKKK
jgi:hypothetical protein